MNAIKQLNIILYKSTKNRHVQWESYRNHLTDYIVGSIPDKVDSILILGCGQSDDLDLFKIKEKCNKLVISDIDREALETAKISYGLDSSDSKILELDVTGLNNNILWNNFVSEIIRMNTKNQITSLFDQLRKIILDYSFGFSTENFDIIIISPIYTQLLFQQGMSYISILNNFNYANNLIEHIQNELLSLMPKVIEKFNLEVVKYLKKDGRIVVISDIFETAIPSEFYENLKSLENIDILHSEYVKKFGMGLGDYGLYHIEKLLKYQQHQWFEWPFSDKKSLFVKVVNLKN